MGRCCLQPLSLFPHCVFVCVAMPQTDTFMKQLASFTGEHIDPEAMHRLQSIIDDPLFTFDKLATKSAAAAHLCDWVRTRVLSVS